MNLEEIKKEALSVATKLCKGYGHYLPLNQEDWEHGPGTQRYEQMDPKPVAAALLEAKADVLGETLDDIRLLTGTVITLTYRRDDYRRAAEELRRGA